MMVRTKALGLCLATTPLLACSSQEPGERDLREPGELSVAPEATANTSGGWKTASTSDLLLAARIGSTNLSVISTFPQLHVESVSLSSGMLDVTALGDSIALLRQASSTESTLEGYCVAPGLGSGRSRLASASNALPVKSGARLEAIGDAGWFWVRTSDPEGKNDSIALYHLACRVDPLAEPELSLHAECSSSPRGRIVVPSAFESIFLDVVESTLTATSLAHDASAPFVGHASEACSGSSTVHKEAGTEPSLEGFMDNFVSFPRDRGNVFATDREGWLYRLASEHFAPLFQLSSGLNLTSVQVRSLGKSFGTSAAKVVVFSVGSDQLQVHDPRSNTAPLALTVGRAIRDVYAYDLDLPIVVSHDRTASSNWRGYSVVSADGSVVRLIDTRLQVAQVVPVQEASEVWISLVDPTGGAGEVRIESLDKSIRIVQQRDPVIDIGQLATRGSGTRVYVLSSAGDGEVLSFASSVSEPETKVGFDIQSRCSQSKSETPSYQSACTP